ncbi:hypothetical protein [Pseudarthrobacter phenanthrenivorans]|uniref:hypothetical protein n=1 Tax=Pseudarthrobacter phenanthrenivorans TaxID=361575 RepID=UPI0002D61A4F|nr:hypothetical protein [Pseudarthrobacter phenanthrenivorans]
MPTTPGKALVLRPEQLKVTWDHGAMPAKCGVLIFAPYFHRDSRRLPAVPGPPPPRNA